MRFLIDAQLPPSLATFLQDHGQEAVHVDGLKLARTDDLQIWNYARQHGSVILTKDEDFLDRWLLAEEKVPVVLIRIGNCTNRILRQWFLPLLPEIVDKLKAGETFIELT